MEDDAEATAADEGTSDESADDGPSEQERLKVYGISKLKAQHLIVGEGETVNVSLRGSGAERYKRFAHRVPIKTADHLKRVIGVPDEVATKYCRCPEGLTQAFSGEFEKIEDLSESQREQLRAATDAYVHGNSELVAHYAPAIDKALSLVEKAAVSLIGFLDITVERNAVMNVSPSVDVLFARNVLIKLGGKIRFTSPLKVDCSSIRGEESLMSAIVVDPGGMIASRVAASSGGGPQ